MAKKIEYHLYHAEAYALEGKLHLPFVHEIGHQAHARLGEKGGYVHHRSEKFRAEGAISYEAARTHVAGNRDPKEGHGWATLATSVIEHFNIMDIVTADRIVAQIGTDHPTDGYVPTVSFLGTRFENLRIAGHPVEIDLDLDHMGPKPKNDGGYLSDRAFVERATVQHQRIRSQSSLPTPVADRYRQPPASTASSGSIKSSLVNRAEGGYPGRSFGHVVDVPNFGRIYLATLEVQESDFAKKGIPKKTMITLKMIEFEMGCMGQGGGSAVGAGSNGVGGP